MRKPILPILCVLIVVSSNLSSFAADSQTPAQEAVAALAKGHRQTALSVYQEMKKGEGNRIFSPYALTSTLTMLYAGMKGKTAGQTALVLHTDLSPERFAEALGTFRTRLATDVTGRERRLFRPVTTNVIWGQKGIAWLPEFLTTIKKFQTVFLEADFQEPAAAHRTILRELGQATGNRFAPIVPADLISNETRMLAVSTVHFFGQWALRFNLSQPAKIQFQLSKDKSLELPAMNRVGEYRSVVVTDSVRAVELAYEDNDWTMLIIVPLDQNDIAEAESYLNPQKLDWLQSVMVSGHFKLVLPRFAINSASDLTPALKALGMADAFGFQADFSGMVVAANPQLRMERVWQYVRMEAEPNGFKGETVVYIPTGALAVPPAPATPAGTVVINRPFVFLVQDARSGCILLIGRVMNPRPAQ